MWQAIHGLSADLEGIPIRRLLPRARRRLVGPWCFLDLYGPLEVGGRTRMDVAPHPHLGLQTVSWVLEGEVLHNDSLGLSGLARPGVVNVMTAGRGIAHSEESPEGAGGALHGIQLWIALPDADRDSEPAFEQHGDLPRLDLDGGSATVFAGTLAGLSSPARAFSPLVGAEVTVGPGRVVSVPLDPAFEHAVVLLSGEVTAEEAPLAPDVLYAGGPGAPRLRLHTGASAARLLLIGGAPFGETPLLWWNFVARTSDELEAARDDWEAGRRFGEVSAYRGARLDAPPFVARPVPPTPAR